MLDFEHRDYNKVLVRVDLPSSISSVNVSQIAKFAIASLLKKGNSLILALQVFSSDFELSYDEFRP